MAIDLPPNVEERLSDYERGWIDGVSQFAWWKDGTQYVGTTGWTLRGRVESFLAERGHPIEVTVSEPR